MGKRALFLPPPGAHTHLRSTLQIWVSRDLPEPHGSIKYWESITTARTPPMSWASSCSTERDTRVHIPLGKSVFQVLQQNKPTGGNSDWERKKTQAQCWGLHWHFLAQIPSPVTWIQLMVLTSVCKVYTVRCKAGFSSLWSRGQKWICSF